MKKVKIMAVLCLLGLSSFAQDSLVQLKSLYAGILANAKFSTDSFHVAKNANARAGAWIAIPFSKTIDAESWAALHVETGETPYVLSAYWINWKPGKAFKLSAGNLPTPVSEFRPHPVSSDGQFETWTEALLPGVTTGIKAAYTHGDFRTKVGAFYRNDHATELSGTIVYKNIGIGAFGRDDHAYGGAITFDHTHFYTIASITDKNAGNFVCIKTKHFNLYSDIGFERQNGRLVRGEWGIIKNFTVKSYSGVIAMGFQNETHTVNTYLFFHL